MNQQEIIVLSLTHKQKAYHALKESGIAEMWKKNGCRANLIGSFRMGLSASHRAIDLHVYSKGIKEESSFAISAQIAKIPGVIEIKVVCAHPVRGHYIQGFTNMEEAIVPAIYDSSRIDFQVMVGSEEAIEMAPKLIRYEGLFVGISSGAKMYAALQVANQIESGNIVGAFPDRA